MGRWQERVEGRRSDNKVDKARLKGHHSWRVSHRLSSTPLRRVPAPRRYRSRDTRPDICAGTCTLGSTRTHTRARAGALKRRGARALARTLASSRTVAHARARTRTHTHARHATHTRTRARKHTHWLTQGRIPHRPRSRRRSHTACQQRGKAQERRGLRATCGQRVSSGAPSMWREWQGAAATPPPLRRTTRARVTGA